MTFERSLGEHPLLLELLHLLGGTEGSFSGVVTGACTPSARGTDRGRPHSRSQLIYREHERSFPLSLRSVISSFCAPMAAHLRCTFATLAAKVSLSAIRDGVCELFLSHTDLTTNIPASKLAELARLHHFSDSRLPIHRRNRAPPAGNGSRGRRYY